MTDKIDIKFSKYIDDNIFNVRCDYCFIDIYKKDTTELYMNCMICDKMKKIKKANIHVELINMLYDNNNINDINIRKLILSHVLNANFIKKYKNINILFSKYILLFCKYNHNDYESIKNNFTDLLINSDTIEQLKLLTKSVGDITILNYILVFIAIVTDYSDRFIILWLIFNEYINSSIGICNVYTNNIHKLANYGSILTYFIYDYHYEKNEKNVYDYIEYGTLYDYIKYMYVYYDVNLELYNRYAMKYILKLFCDNCKIIIDKADIDIRKLYLIIKNILNNKKYTSIAYVFKQLNLNYNFKFK